MQQTPVDPCEIIVTDRLRLQPIRAEDAGSLIMPLRAARLYRYSSEIPPTSVNGLKRQFHYWTDQGPCYVTRDTTSCYAIGLVRVMYVGDGRALVMCKTFSQFVGNQYSREAVFAIADRLAEGGVLVEAHVDFRNESAIRLFDAVGFIQQSLIENADYIKGQPSHDIRYVFAP
jgi:RimJ/RimL family protein N-acetyltransferase